MKLVFLIGNGAAGKMTVGQELMKQTKLRLFHNDMTIEPVIESFGCYDSAVINRMRDVVFEKFARSDNEGMIFTYMWAFDHLRLENSHMSPQEGASIICSHFGL